MKKRLQGGHEALKYAVYWKWHQWKTWKHTYTYRNYQGAKEYASALSKPFSAKQVKIVRIYKSKRKIVKRYNY